MSVPWRRPNPTPTPLVSPVADRREEISTAVQANHAAHADAEATKEHTRRLAARVQWIHAALMSEGAANHFTERWEKRWGANS